MACAYGIVDNIHNAGGLCLQAETLPITSPRCMQQ
jgi:hypothetical protein